jgi:hypothetical protein
LAGVFHETGATNERRLGCRVNNFWGEQIEQAKRLAAAMTKLRDRERFERDASIIGVKSDYQREIGDNCD